MKSRILLNSACFLITGLLMTACGTDSPTPATPSQQNDAKITEIVSTISNINTRLDKLEKVTAAKSSSSNTTTKVTPAKTSTTETAANPVKETPASIKPADTSTAKAPVSDDSKGRKILDKLITTFNSANGIEMIYDKYEKNPDTGKVRDTGTHLWAKNPDTILFELIRNPEDTGKVGTKIKYNVNDTKAKARSTGIASIATVSLDLTDDRIVSPNGYLLNQADVISLFKRLKSPGYNADLVGKTTINGEEVYILKVTDKEKNTMDARIEYENIGFSPKDYTLRLWEVFTKNNDKPFLKLNVTKFQFINNITEEQMKL